MAQAEMQYVAQLAALDTFRTMFSSAFTDLDSCTDYMSKEASEILDTLGTEGIDEASRLQKGDILAELGYPKLFVKMWQAMPPRNSLQRMQRMRMARAFWNYTDKSKSFCLELGKAGALELILHDLESLETSRRAQTKDQINTNFTIVYNCVRLCDENREICRRFRSKENKTSVEILSCYLDDESLIIKTISLVTLAFIVDETENEKLATTGSDGCVTYLVSLLEESLKWSNHRAESVDFSTDELMACLNELAENDANKVKIVQEGAVPLLAKILKAGFNDEEQEMAARVLWKLAFVASNKEAICRNEDAVKGTFIINE